ncbi:MAG TPA: 4-alpha-glucanotransferase [Jatrophihabitans sp.]|uniref:4-alpha-glucanotransferase n=1 Tax=Jatrophihabitans sp. TaxID=1932789 RepID=UPI002DFB5163|nr:4-alpha-glucanotransferase [Jatrophihabitans sp.]
MDSSPDDARHRLAAAFAVDTEYYDWQGRHQLVGDATLIAVLAAFEVDATTLESCASTLDALARRRAEQVLPPCVVARAGTVVRVPVTPGTADARIELESGPVVPARVDGDAVDLPTDLPTGYHRLVLGDGVVELIVTPDRLTWPTELDAPAWGFATQLYSVRSRASWGIGDLADLTTLAQWSAREHGADFVLVNPVHAAEVVAPIEPSPYLPTSRRYGDPIYLRVEDVPEYASLDAATRTFVDDLGVEVRAAAAADELLDRETAWAARLAALRIVHAAGLPADRAAAYARYCRDEGAALQRFATWCALSEVHGGDWHEWPVELRDAGSPAVAAAAAALEPRIDFFRYLQWLLHEQLLGAQQASRTAGMRLGVVHDLAVGVSPSGADAWAFRDVMADGLTVGAPPDAYSQTGQDWQQPPWRPDRLAELAYAPLRELFRNTLRHSGGIRVDHIIGLFRLWWIPDGLAADEGTYVHYDHEAIIGILTLEAERAGAVVIGEDLGNVEPWVRVYLRERGLLGTSIFWFEGDWDAGGGPLPAERWRVDCLASVTTHDLPPTTGYLAGDHIRLRDRLGLLTRSLDDELAAARHDQQAWLAEVSRVGLLDPDATDGAEIVRALHAYLARTPSRLRCVALTDAVGERRTQNQPGTSGAAYPNWRVPLGGPNGRAVFLEDALADPEVARLVELLR